MIRTNNHFRPLLDFYELPESEQLEQAEYLGSVSVQESTFFKYKGIYYSLDEAMRLDDDSKWHGVIGLTNTSSLVVELSNCGDGIKVGLAF